MVEPFRKVLPGFSGIPRIQKFFGVKPVLREETENRQRSLLERNPFLFFRFADEQFVIPAQIAERFPADVFLSGSGLEPGKIPLMLQYPAKFALQEGVDLFLCGVQGRFDPHRLIGMHGNRKRFSCFQRQIVVECDLLVCKPLLHGYAGSSLFCTARSQIIERMASISSSVSEAPYLFLTVSKR